MCKYYIHNNALKGNILAKFANSIMNILLHDTDSDLLLLCILIKTFHRFQRNASEFIQPGIIDVIVDDDITHIMHVYLISYLKVCSH